MMRRDHGSAVLICLLAASCGSDGGGAEDAWVDDPAEDALSEAVEEPVEDVTDGADAVDVPHDGTTGGEFLMLTYNVAGLPESLSSSNPAEYIPQISPLLNGYDIVVVQEDFWYHPQLIAEAEHPYMSDPMVESPTLTNLGDGLNRLSVFPFTGHQRITWADCNGTFDCLNDCLTPKGFAMARHELGSGAGVDVYNLHMDAGSCAGDFTARGVQVDQLIAEVGTRSAGQAVIVAGDTNLSAERSQDMVMLDRLIADLGLTDACRALGCGVETLDRVLYRSSASVDLSALEWAYAEEFVDGAGHDLSDHLAVRVWFSWEAL